MKRQSSLKPHQVAILTATVLSVALWFVPVLRWLTVPVQYLNTHIHEACHALAAVVTGGEVSHIEVHSNGSGETYTALGSDFIIASAGYLGASLVGALIVAFSRTAKAAKGVLIGMSVLLAYSLLVWVRTDLFGIVSGIGWMALLWVLAMYLKDEQRLFAAQFLGIQQCVNAIQSLFFLVQISGFGVAHSDAAHMQQITRIPAIAWAGLWSILSLAMMAVALKISWQGEKARSRPYESEWVA